MGKSPFMSWELDAHGMSHTSETSGPTFDNLPNSASRVGHGEISQVKAQRSDTEGVSGADDADHDINAQDSSQGPAQLSDLGDASEAEHSELPLNQREPKRAGTININKNASAERYRAAYLAAITRKSSPPSGSISTVPFDNRSGEHDARYMHGTPASSSPRGTSTATHGSQSTIRGDLSWLPDPERHMSKLLKLYRRLHDQALAVIPHRPLARHRYWIAVLEQGKSPNSATTEKSFTWMKGNRLTTVETVWRTYSTSTASDDFVLLMGWDKVDWTEEMVELDYFNQKLIVFRCVHEKSEEAEGIHLSEALVPSEKEIIEIEDDD